MALRERLKKVGKYALRAALGLALLAGIAHVVWVRSGDGEWTLVRDDDGIQIYTRKDPGTALLKFRAVTRMKTSLSSVVFMYRGDESTANDFGGRNFRIFRRLETDRSYLSYYSVIQPMPEPLAPREFVSMLNYAQDQKTGEVAIRVQAAPSAMPPTPGAVRVKVMSNLFRVTPMPNGEVQLEITLDADMSVFYPLINGILADELHKETVKQRKLLATEKYRKARMKSVREF